MQRMRLRPLRRLPIAFGWLTMRGDAATARWLEAILEWPEVRSDTVRVLRALARDRDLMGKTAQRPRGFDRPALVVWASEHRVMPREHRRRLADLLAQGRSSRSRSATRSSRSTSPDHWCMPIREFVAEARGSQR